MDFENGQFQEFEKLSSYSIQSGWADITPLIPLPLVCSNKAPINFDSVQSPLEANLIVLRNNDQKILFLSLDVLIAGSALKESILSKFDGLINAHELFIWASHTHYAPSIDPYRPVLGCCDERFLKFVSEEVSSLIKRVLLSPPIEVKLSYGESEDERLTINRRRRGLYFNKKSSIVVPHWGMAHLPNINGFREGRISTILMRDHQGQPLAIIWNFACHPVESPGNNKVRAEYPGEMRQLLRKQFHNEIPVVFLQGFSGDLTSPSFSKKPKNGGIGKILYFLLMKTINGQFLDNFDEIDWSAYINSMWQVMRIASGSDNRLELKPALEIKSKELELTRLGLVSNRNLKLCSIKIGEIRIISMSAEVVAEWGPIIRRIFPEDIVINAGCFDDVFGYLPIEEMIQEGGYEVERFMHAFNITGRYESGIEQKIISELFKFK